MGIAGSTWRQMQSNLAQDFLDLFLPPSYAFSVETKYPITQSAEALINDRFNSLDLPERKLLHLKQLLEESSPEGFVRRVADWATVFAYDVLEGLRYGSAPNLSSSTFDGLKLLATIWGSYLAREVERVLHWYRLFTAASDIMADVSIRVFRRIPAKELGEVIRESITPAYIRAGETVRYELALFDNNQTKLKESIEVLLASDAELERGIANTFSGYSTKELGTWLRRIMVDGLSQLNELFSSSEYNEELLSSLPIACRHICWYLGNRVNRNLRYDPQRTARLLEVISRHKEIIAAMEQYRYRYSWQGDRNKAIALGWQAVAPRYFHLSGSLEDIKEDVEQEKLLGVAEGLEDYTGKNRAMEAITDGFLGRLRVYLKRAAENQEKDYVRKQTTDGNIALTHAKHAQDLRPRDREEDLELTDEKILSREREKYYPSCDSIVEQLESKETVEEWYNSLTEKEKTATDLKSAGYAQAEIARMMGISQQWVSQLLQQSLRKYQKLKIHG